MGRFYTAAAVDPLFNGASHASAKGHGLERSNFVKFARTNNYGGGGGIAELPTAEPSIIQVSSNLSELATRTAAAAGRVRK